MAAEVRGRPFAAIVPPARRWRWLSGDGSVFGKTLRDSRFGMLTIVLVLGGIIVAGGGVMASTYATVESRHELAVMSASMPPALRGLYGNPVSVDTLGGFVSWHYAAYLALLAGLWSILALSSTLAGEARRGSLDLALATPLSRRAIALQKIAGHVSALTVGMGLIALATWAVGAFAARFPGDEISPSAAIAFGAGIEARALIAGSVAFALAPFLGRGLAAGLAGGLMVAGYVLNGYRGLVPAFRLPADLTWFSWMNGHLPLAGQVDWPATGLVTLVAAGLLAIGVEAFARRDVGVTSMVRVPAVPRLLAGLRGPLGRSSADLLPGGLSWGIGLGLYGFAMAASSRALLDELARSPSMLQAVRGMMPGVDITTSAGFLQLAFVDLGLVLAALGAASFVASRSSDETAGRLELLLSTPLSRGRWATASGVAVWLTIATAVTLLAASIGAGVALAGGDPWRPALGTGALALYAGAMAGIGLAVGGVTRPSLAAPVVVAVAIGTFLVDMFAEALRLPDWVQQLALSTHMGEPMVGSWDPAGIVACVVLAVGGLALGTWGVRRRDIG